LFLGSNDKTTLDFISYNLGKQTIATRNGSYTKGGRGGYSVQYGILGRELMKPDEIKKMKNDDCILFIRGYNPLKSRKLSLESHKRYKQLAT
jgi:type IV secretion system protein VirD4